MMNLNLFGNIPDEYASQVNRDQIQCQLVSHLGLGLIPQQVLRMNAEVSGVLFSVFMKDNGYVTTTKQERDGNHVYCTKTADQSAVVGLLLKLAQAQLAPRDLVEFVEMLIVEARSEVEDVLNNKTRFDPMDILSVHGFTYKEDNVNGDYLHFQNDSNVAEVKQGEVLVKYVYDKDKTNAAGGALILKGVQTHPNVFVFTDALSMLSGQLFRGAHVQGIPEGEGVLDASIRGTFSYVDGEIVFQGTIKGSKFQIQEDFVGSAKLKPADALIISDLKGQIMSQRYGWVTDVDDLVSRLPFTARGKVTFNRHVSYEGEATYSGYVPVPHGQGRLVVPLLGIDVSGVFAHGRLATDGAQYSIDSGNFVRGAAVFGLGVREIGLKLTEQRGDQTTVCVFGQDIVRDVVAVEGEVHRIVQSALRGDQWVFFSEYVGEIDRHMFYPHGQGELALADGRVQRGRFERGIFAIIQNPQPKSVPEDPQERAQRVLAAEYRPAPQSSWFQRLVSKVLCRRRSTPKECIVCFNDETQTDMYIANHAAGVGNGHALCRGCILAYYQSVIERAECPYCKKSL